MFLTSVTLLCFRILFIFLFTLLFVLLQRSFLLHVSCRLAIGVSSLLLFVRLDDYTAKFLVIATTSRFASIKSISGSIPLWVHICHFQTERRLTHDCDVLAICLGDFLSNADLLDRYLPFSASWGGALFSCKVVTLGQLRLIRMTIRECLTWIRSEILTTRLRSLPRSTMLEPSMKSIKTGVSRGILEDLLARKSGDLIALRRFMMWLRPDGLD